MDIDELVSPPNRVTYACARSLMLGYEFDCCCCIWTTTCSGPTCPRPGPKTNGTGIENSWRLKGFDCQWHWHWKVHKEGRYPLARCALGQGKRQLLVNVQKNDGRQWSFQCPHVCLVVTAWRRMLHASTTHSCARLSRTCWRRTHPVPT